MSSSARIVRLAIVALGFISVDAVAWGADLHVPAEYASIQAAIGAAQPGDVVIVADGTYTGDGNRDLSFEGKAITVRSANGPAGCIIDCKGTPEMPHRGFEFISGEGPDSVLEGFTITGGATPPGAIADVFNGGGILCNGSSPTIRNCTLVNNQCGCWGGAVCCTAASPVIVDCRIVGNHADDDGGGIFAWSTSAPTIVNTLVANNDTAFMGGGIGAFGGELTIVNSTVVGNSASSVGGVQGWGTTIVNSIIWGNENVELSGNADVTYSVVAGGYEGEGNLDLDPAFVDPVNGDFHLAADSPLVDRGNTTAVPAGVVADFEGDPRIIGLGVDIGADEVRLLADIDIDGDVDVDDLVQLLLAWGPCPGCPADLTGDGVVNVDDLIELILSWG